MSVKRTPEIEQGWRIKMAYPDQRMNAQAGIPGRINDVITRIRASQINGARTDQMIRSALESILIACAVQADVSAVESGSDVLEFALESVGALA